MIFIKKILIFLILEKHLSRGNAWTETMIFGNTIETDQCAFNIRNQSSTPVENKHNY